jgi:hypothetical protein
MIKISIAKRYALIALVLAVGAGLFWLDFGRRYIRAGSVKDSRAAQDGMEAAEPGAWERLFERRQPGKEEMAVIVEKNVFSPRRTAWAPPPPPEPAPEEPEAPEPPPPPPPAKRDGVELRGTAMVGDTRTAMVHFKTFNPPETLILREGAAAKSKSAQKPEFTVVRIEPDKVMMKDAAGAEFQVGLYDHPRQVASQAPAQAPAVVSTAAPAAPAPTGSVAGEASAGSIVGKTPPKNLSPAEVQRERNEQLVKEGKMRKINTPFGPVYRQL